MASAGKPEQRGLMADILNSSKREHQKPAEFADARLRVDRHPTWCDPSLVGGDTFNETIRAELLAGSKPYGKE